MNKPRPSALPLKKAIRVSPPTAPGGFFSFSSFRVKKGQSSKGDASSSSSESSNRRRTASGDCEPSYSSHFYSDSSSSSTPWAAAVVSPLATQKFFNPNNDNGSRLSTFKTFHAESAPSTPGSRPDYRFVGESSNFPCSPSRTTYISENFDYTGVPLASLENDQTCGGSLTSVGVASEMHKGYYDQKSGPNHSLIADTNELHGKPPSGVIRHHPLRSNSEPHGGHYYGGPPPGTTDLGPPPPAPSNNHPHQHHGLSSSSAATTNIYASHHIVLEDQGIDMSQSPGHESPSSTVSSNTISVSGGSGVSSSVGSSGGSAGSGSTGCRHSAASFDSGRASSSLYQQGVRYSGLSSESSSTGSCRHSYHSSSSSLGSIPPEEICNFDVSSMIAQGLPDSEILNAWLTGVHFECYYQNFIQAGYDMQTIVKMTPEDLNAIGITKPNHRKRLKSEISQLIIPDGLPDYIPSTIEEWLRALRMEEYTEKLKAQGYTNVRQVTNIMWEDLEEIGILKLGHQKKFLLAIKRIEDILSGKRIHTAMSVTHPAYHPAMDIYAVPHRQNSQPANAGSQMPYHNQGPASQHGPSARAYMNSFHQQQQKSFSSSQQSVPPFSTWRQHSLGSNEGHYASYNPHGDSLYSSTTNSNGEKQSPHLQLLTHQPQIHSEKPPPLPATNGLSQQPEYHPEVIAIHVKGERLPSAIAAEHCGEPIYGTSSFQAPPPGSSSSSSTTALRNSMAQQQGVGKWMDDGETTPTNEADSRGHSYAMDSTTAGTSSFGTLPRLMKNKTLAKTAVGGIGMGGHSNDSASAPGSGLDITYQDQLEWQQQQQQQIHQSAMDGYKSLPKNIGRFQNSTFRGNPGVPTSAVAGGGRHPPPPPRRSSSTTQDTSTFSTFHPALSTIKRQSSWSNCSNSGDDTDLPMPPPPEDLALISTGPSSAAGVDATSVPSTASLHHHHHLNSSSNKMSTSSSTSLTASASLSNNTAASTAPSTTNLGSSDYHHNHHNQYSSTSTYAKNPSTNAVASSSSSSSFNNGCSTTNTNSSSSSSRNIHHPSTTGNAGRLRDPSPGAESDLSTSFATVGVRRNGSDASFKSSSSTESESIPFANDNAGTIKQQKPSNRSATGTGTALESIYGTTTSASANSSTGEHIEAGDVLSDIGNMLADLTDELDAILQQEMDSLNKR